MRKHYLALCLFLTAILFLVGCANKEEKSPIQMLEEKGQGYFWLENDNGNTRNRQPLVVLLKPGEGQVELRYVARSFNPEPTSYLYLDDNIIKELHLSNSEGIISLKKEALRQGLHQVVIRQFPDNNPNTVPTVIKQAKYEVKIVQ